MYVSVSVLCKCHGGQKKTLDPIETELQTVISYHVGAKNQPQVLCKSSQLPNPLKQFLLLKTYLVMFNARRLFF